MLVVTHEPPAEPAENGVYTFVTDGIENELEQAKVSGLDDHHVELEPIEVVHTDSAGHMLFDVIRDQ